MKIGLITVLLLLHPVLASAQDVVSPEAVRLENVRVDGEMKIVRVGSAQAHYMLFCNVKLDGCLTPERGRKYVLIDQNTRWKMPGAKEFLTLAFLQDLLGKYDGATSEHIGLVEQGGGGGLGIFLLDRGAGGYQRDTIFSDGPIIYGTGMSDADRQKAWKHFFMQMVETVLRQQGQDVLGVKLAKRCLPGQDFCTTALDAQLAGVGGTQEPRNVVLTVILDRHDESVHLARVVCVWPAGEKVCRDWNTGKFIPGN